MAAYHRRLTGEDELAQMAAAKAWSVWEGMCSTLKPNPNVVHHFADPHTALALARIESHYFANDIFLQPNQLLADAHKIADIPTVIVHGRPKTLDLRVPQSGETFYFLPLCLVKWFASCQ